MVSITHDDTLRTQHHALADRALSARINTLYLQIKTDLARLTDAVEIPLAHRQMVRTKLQELVLAHPDGAATFDITLPWTTDTPHTAGWQLRRTMQFALEPTPTP